MNNIGFDGGNVIYEMGPLADVCLFFRCLEDYTPMVCRDYNWHLISDRFYRRYLSKEQLNDALIVMKRIEESFVGVSSEVVYADSSFQEVKEITRLNLGQETLAGVFKRYFVNFGKAKKSAEAFLEDFNIYRPLRVLPSDIPAMFIEGDRPLSEYDALGPTDPPFWLR
jgi:hypothetical protein